MSDRVTKKETQKKIKNALEILQRGGCIRPIYEVSQTQAAMGYTLVENTLSSCCGSLVYNSEGFLNNTHLSRRNEPYYQAGYYKGRLGFHVFLDTLKASAKSLSPIKGYEKEDIFLRSGKRRMYIAWRTQ